MTRFALDAGAGALTLRMNRGNGFRASIAVSRQKIGTPLSVAGYQVRAFATLLDTGERVCDFDVAIVDAERGRIDISMARDTTLDIEAGSYWWELEWDTPEGFTRTIIEGVLEVLNRGRHA